MKTEVSYLVLAVYFVALLVIGYLSTRKKSADDYLLAGRKLGGWAIAFTIAASFVGGNTIINYTGLVYRWGFAMLWVIGGMLVGFLITVVIAPRLKAISDRHGLHTMSGYFAVKFGTFTGLLAT